MLLLINFYNLVILKEFYERELSKAWDDLKIAGWSRILILNDSYTPCLINELHFSFIREKIINKNFTKGLKTKCISQKRKSGNHYAYKII